MSEGSRKQWRATRASWTREDNMHSGDSEGWAVEAAQITVSGRGEAEDEAVAGIAGAFEAGTGGDVAYSSRPATGTHVADGLEHASAGSGALVRSTRQRKGKGSPTELTVDPSARTENWAWLARLGAPSVSSPVASQGIYLAAGSSPSREAMADAPEPLGDPDQQLPLDTPVRKIRRGWQRTSSGSAERRRSDVSREGNLNR